MIQRLIEKGYAYPAGGDVYFDITKDDDYGKLCNRDPEHWRPARASRSATKKRNPGDFALWKGAKPGEPASAVDSPWGPAGRAGTSSAPCMSMKLLGETLDIHGGGLDLQFPHHENELAQSESLHRQAVRARTGCTTGCLKMGTAKMAGSVGNVVNVADALKHVSGEVLRFFLLNTHYRSPIDLGDWDREEPGRRSRRAARGAKSAYETFVRFAERVQRVTGKPFAELPAPTTAGRIRHDSRSRRSRSSISRFRELHGRRLQHRRRVGVLFELVTR